MFSDYHIQEGLLFKDKKLRIPQGSVRLNLVKEIHNGGLGGHLCMDKTTTFGLASIRMSGNLLSVVELAN